MIVEASPIYEDNVKILQSIKGDKFYILTHPEMKPAIEHRMRQILDEKTPGIDPMMRALLG